MQSHFIELVLHYSISIIPSFLVALFVSALIVEFLPDNIYDKILNQNNFLFVVISSIIGALIPICTCGMIPLASKLHKKGTSWLLVISFLTAGNASSLTALFMTFVLGVEITFGRFVFAVIFGILVSYIFVLLFKPQSFLEEEICHEENLSMSKAKKITLEFVSLIKSFGPWVITAIFIAAFISLFLHPILVLQFGGVGNTFAPFLFSVIGFPFYFCAGADIPISSAFLEKGAGLGSVLAFMTASPGVNFTSLLIYQKWIGLKSSIIYMIISVIVCGLLGLIVNLIVLPLTPYEFR